MTEFAHTHDGRAGRWKEAGSLVILGRQTVQPQKQAQDSSPCDDKCLLKSLESRSPSLLY